VFSFPPRNHAGSIGVLFVLLATFGLNVFLSSSSPAQSFDTLRICTYNLLNYPGSTSATRNPQYKRIVNAINPDILVVQEMTSAAGVTEFTNNVMNSTVPGKYGVLPFHDGPDTDNEIFYRLDKIASVTASYIPTALRDIAEYIVQPVNSIEQLRIYSFHLKASSGLANESLRRAEATILRNHVNSLPAGTNFIFVGDYNTYSSNDSGFQALIGSQSNNTGRAFDPLNLIGTWNSNASIARYHTQSPRIRQFDGGANGGLDDRFDIILTSASMQDNILTATYTAYGNDGNHFNDSINRLPNAAVPDSIANAIHNCSDHLPVFANFIFPTSPLPIQLSAFNAVFISGSVILNWETLSETNNYGFEVQKKFNVDPDFTTVLNSFVPGNGTTLIPHQYSYTDHSTQTGLWWYRLKQIDLDGSIHFTDPVQVDIPTSVPEAVPESFSLSQNYPNPFNPSTSITFSVGASGLAKLEVFDVLGQKVDEIFNNYAESGRSYTVKFDASEIPSGVYFYHLVAGSSSKVTGIKRMVLVK
jgi:endonuclease/exonuclease/phosphatase family metal-dependent hydrolase